MILINLVTMETTIVKIKDIHQNVIIKRSIRSMRPMISLKREMIFTNLILAIDKKSRSLAKVR